MTGSVTVTLEIEFNGTVHTQQAWACLEKVDSGLGGQSVSV